MTYRTITIGILALLVGLAGGYEAGRNNHPLPNLAKEAPPAIPSVLNACDHWIIQEDSPDYYWDTGPEDSTSSTADYYTIETSYPDPPDDTPHPQGAYTTLPVPPTPYFTINYWDADRPEPQLLITWTIKVPPTPHCNQ